MTETADKIVYRVLEEKDIEAATQLIAESFFVDEPLCASLEFNSSDESVSYIENLVKACARDAISVVAENTAREIIGCRLSTIATPNYSWSCEFLSRGNPSHRKLILMDEFLAEIDVDLFSKYNVDRIMSFQMLNVRADFRNMGVAKKLVSESVRLGLAKGIRLVKVVASNKATIRLYANLNYDRVNSIRYDEYKDEHGEIVFKNLDDHVQSVLYAKFIDS